VAVIDGYRYPDERLVAVHGSRRFLGELGLLTGQAAFFSAVVVEPGEVLVVPVERLRALIAQDSSLGDLLLRAYFLQRELLIGLGAGLRIIGSRFSPDTRRLREFVARNRLPHRWIDLEQDANVDALLRELGISPGGDADHHLARRGPAQPFQRRARPRRRADQHHTNCTQRLRSAGRRRGSIRTGRIGLRSVGGFRHGRARRHRHRWAGSNVIEDRELPRLPAGISGAELAERAAIQARKFGARITVPAEAVALECQEDHYLVRLVEREILAHTIVVASGARYRRLPVPRLEEHEPRHHRQAHRHGPRGWHPGRRRGGTHAARSRARHPHGQVELVDAHRAGTPVAHCAPSTRRPLPEARDR
jgi:thioredoxin reductase (NADPH)